MPVAVVFLDASVLYPAPLRDLLLELAVSDLYRAKWSARVHDEWMQALLRNRPELASLRLERTRQLMDAHVRDALVTGYEDIVPTIDIPDPDDRHIVAAAVRAEADTVLTVNLKDFPSPSLAPLGLKAEHPDDFLLRLYRNSPIRFLDALHRVRERLRRPPLSVEQHLHALSQSGLHGTVEELLSQTASTGP